MLYLKHIRMNNLYLCILKNLLPPMLLPKISRVAIFVFLE